MRYGALLVMLAAGLGLAGCGGPSKPLTTTNTNQSANSTVMLDPPLSVPPGFNAPPLETAAATPQQEAGGDQAAPSQPTLGQMTMSQPTLAQTTLSQPTLGQTAGGQSTPEPTDLGSNRRGTIDPGPAQSGAAASWSARGGPAGDWASRRWASRRPWANPAPRPPCRRAGRRRGSRPSSRRQGPATSIRTSGRKSMPRIRRRWILPWWTSWSSDPRTPSANGAGVVIQRTQPGMLDTLF